MPPGKGMIPTDLEDESESEDDPTLDRSGVPLPPKEPEAASSAASSGINPAASGYMTDIRRESDGIKMNKKHPVQFFETGGPNPFETGGDGKEGGQPPLPDSRS